MKNIFRNRKKIMMLAAAFMLIYASSHSSAFEPISWLLIIVVTALIGAFTNVWAWYIQQILKGIAWFVMVNPHIWPVGDPGQKYSIYMPFITVIQSNFLKIFQVWYVIAIIFVGIYLIFMNASPHGRSRAKDSLTRLLVGMVLVSQSPLIL
ncbi:MAG TPA: hypothetical protein ENN13_03890, partial [Candidatus Altiarchaeales archaeon]|nr:hypothetical protein [Candidatus Altiarchaeales archaeon]